jgi:hypothetical protein
MIRSVKVFPFFKKRKIIFLLLHKNKTPRININIFSYLTGDSISRIMARRRRSNKMLIIVTVTHFLSWLPLNVVNIIFTTFDSEKTPLFSNIEHLFITYAVCHLASMTSAVSNPILYGFMNENFRREFKIIWLGLKKCVYCCKNDSNLSQPPEEIPIASTKKPWKKMSIETLPATNV